MNRYVDEDSWWIEGAHGLRDELLGLLTTPSSPIRPAATT